MKLQSPVIDRRQHSACLWKGTGLSQSHLDLNRKFFSVFYLYHLEQTAIIFEFQHSIYELRKALQILPTTQ